MKKMLGMAALALTLAACGGSSGGGGTTTLACNLASNGLCFQWTDTDAKIALGQSTFGAQCTQQGGVSSSTTACASASRVGRCAVTETQQDISATIVFSYYSPTFTTAMAQSACTALSGTFSN